MYVCICNRLNEDMIRALAEQGLGFEEIQALTGCSSTCGSCRVFAEELVLATQVQARRPLPLRIFVGAT